MNINIFRDGSRQFRQYIRKADKVGSKGILTILGNARACTRLSKLIQREMRARDLRGKEGKRLTKEYQRIRRILAFQIESPIVGLFGEYAEELRRQQKRIMIRQLHRRLIA